MKISSTILICFEAKRELGLLVSAFDASITIVAVYHRLALCYNLSIHTANCIDTPYIAPSDCTFRCTVLESVIYTTNYWDHTLANFVTPDCTSPCIELQPAITRLTTLRTHFTVFVSDCTNSLCCNLSLILLTVLRPHI